MKFIGNGKASKNSLSNRMVQRGEPGSESLHWEGLERRFISPWRHSGRVIGAYKVKVCIVLY